MRIDYEMEGERKRKRAEEAKVGGGGRRRRREKERELKADPDPDPEPVPVPTEEEVEEFYAILRNMHAAVRYFEKVNGDGRKLPGRWEIGQTALEAEELRGVDGVKAGEETVSGMRTNGVLDLNVVPEAESNSS